MLADIQTKKKVNIQTPHSYTTYSIDRKMQKNTKDKTTTSIHALKPNIENTTNMNHRMTDTINATNSSTTTVMTADMETNTIPDTIKASLTDP